jgi:hypothetical protein
MCNFYSITTNQAAIIALFRVIKPVRRQPGADAGRVAEVFCTRARNARCAD